MGLDYAINVLLAAFGFFVSAAELSSSHRLQSARLRAAHEGGYELRVGLWPFPLLFFIFLEIYLLVFFKLILYNS